MEKKAAQPCVATDVLYRTINDMRQSNIWGSTGRINQKLVIDVRLRADRESARTAGDLGGPSETRTWTLHQSGVRRVTVYSASVSTQVRGNIRRTGTLPDLLTCPCDVSFPSDCRDIIMPRALIWSGAGPTTALPALAHSLSRSQLQVSVTLGPSRPSPPCIRPGHYILPSPSRLIRT
jgi:hypothetical protein